MNRIIEHTNKVINLDKLELRLILNDPEIESQIFENLPTIDLGNGLTLVNQYHSTTSHIRNYDLLELNREIGSLGYGSKNSILRKNKEGVYRVSCELMYTQDWSDLVKSSLDGISSIWELKGVNALDIAYDTSVNVLKIIKDRVKSTVFKKLNGKVGITTTDLNSRSDYLIGSRQSEKLIRVYNKSVEIERSNKQKIREFWKVNNLNLLSPIYRFELALSGEKAKPYYEWEKFNDPQFLASIMRTELEKYFGFTYIGKDKKAKTKYSLDNQGVSRIVDLDDFNPIQLAKPSCITPDQRNSAKLVLNALNREFIEETELLKSFQQVISYYKTKYELDYYRVRAA